MTANPYQSPGETERSVARASLPHTVSLQGSMTVTDVLHVQVLLLRRRWASAAILVALYIAFVLALGWLSPSRSVFGNTFLLLGLVIAPGVLPLTLMLVCLRLRRDADRRRGIFVETQTTLSEAGIEAQVGDERVSLPWSTFASFLDSRRVIVLFLKDSSRHLIIARTKLVVPRDWFELLDFLRGRFPPE